MTRPDVATLLDRLGETALECKALIREMHEAEQALKAAAKEAKLAAELARTAADEAVDTDIDQLVSRYVTKYVAELNEHTQKAMRNTSAKVLGEFDKLAEPLLATFGDIEAAFERVMETQRTIAADHRQMNSRLEHIRRQVERWEATVDSNGKDTP